MFSFLFFLLAQVWAQLNYLPANNGFYNNPVLEGGRTELEFADINNDGNIDILSIGDHGSPYVNTQEHGVMVWFGDGQGNWSLYQYGNFGYGGIAAGDVNWDGKWDVGYGMHHNWSGNDLGDDMLEVALGDGTGRFWTAWDDSLVPGGTVWGMFSTDFADVNNDGLLDVGSCSFGYGVGVRVFLNLGTGIWRKSFVPPESSNNNMEFYFRDVNRDGNPDIICGVARAAVYFGDGTGNFYPGDSGLPRSNYGLAGISPGDVDNDGGADLAFVNSNGGIEVWRWDDVSQVWQNFSGNLPVVDSFYATQLVDMNRDGFVDLLGLQKRAVKIWAGDGEGNWTEMATVEINRASRYAAFRAGADFDHNGYPDFAFIVEQWTLPNYCNYAYAYRESSLCDSFGIFPVFPRGGERFRTGSVQFIDWWSEAPGAESSRVRLELSTTGPGGPWSLIHDSLPNSGRFQWLVPDGISSNNCYIKYTVFKGNEERFAVTARSFFIGDPTGVEHRPELLVGGREIKIWSNPVRHRLQLEFKPPVERGERVKLCDQSGRLLKETIIAPGRTEVTFAIGEAGPGVYFIKVANGKPVKFVVAE